MRAPPSAADATPKAAPIGAAFSGQPDAGGEPSLNSLETNHSAHALLSPLLGPQHPFNRAHNPPPPQKPDPKDVIGLMEANQRVRHADHDHAQGLEAAKAHGEREKVRRENEKHASDMLDAHQRRAIEAHAAFHANEAPSDPEKQAKAEQIREETRRANEVHISAMLDAAQKRHLTDKAHDLEVAKAAHERMIAERESNHRMSLADKQHALAEKTADKQNALAEKTAADAHAGEKQTAAASAAPATDAKPQPKTVERGPDGKASAIGGRKVKRDSNNRIVGLE